jgi:hypothetical protein
LADDTGPATKLTSIVEVVGPYDPDASFVTAMGQVTAFSEVTTPEEDTAQLDGAPAPREY